MNSSFYQAGARFYSAELGRFLSPDPIGHGTPANPFEYALSNPVTYNDPTGMCVPDITCNGLWREYQEPLGYATSSGFNGCSGSGLGGGGGRSNSSEDNLPPLTMLTTDRMISQRMGWAGAALTAVEACRRYGCGNSIDDLMNGLGNLFSDGSSLEELIAEELIPPEAGQVLEHVEQHNGAPPKFHKGNRVYENDPPHPDLPANGEFKEYDVYPRSPGSPRGEERIVRDEKSGQAWYSPDHYENFIPIN